MGRVVVEAASPFAGLAPPGLGHRLQHHRTVGLGVDVAHRADRPRVEQALHLGERSDEPVVVTDLTHQAARVHFGRQRFAEVG